MKGYLGVAAVLLSLLFCRVDAVKAEDLRSQAAQICSVPASGSFEGDLEAVSVWLERTGAINANDGSWHSEMARGSLKFAAALQGRPLPDQAFQRMSDALALRFADFVIEHRSVPTLDVIIALEAEVIASELKLENWNWPYAFTDSLPIRFGGFGRDLVQIPGSGFEYAKNVLVATLQFAAGLNRYLFNSSALDFIPLWKHAQAAHRYVSDQLYLLFR